MHTHTHTSLEQPVSSSTWFSTDCWSSARYWRHTTCLFIYLILNWLLEFRPLLKTRLFAEHRGAHDCCYYRSVFTLHNTT